MCCNSSQQTWQRPLSAGPRSSWTSSSFHDTRVDLLDGAFVIGFLLARPSLQPFLILFDNSWPNGETQIRYMRGWSCKLLGSNRILLSSICFRENSIDEVLVHDRQDHSHITALLVVHITQAWFPITGGIIRYRYLSVNLHTFQY